MWIFAPWDFESGLLRHNLLSTVRRHSPTLHLHATAQRGSIAFNAHPMRPQEEPRWPRVSPMWATRIFEKSMRVFLSLGARKVAVFIQSTKTT